MQKGVIVLAHGSREPETTKTMEAVVERVRELSRNDKIRMAFFQFAQPSLEDSVRAFADEGVNDICIVPYFLFSGVHVKEDLPEAIGLLVGEHPGISITVADTLGADRRLAEIVADRISGVT